MAVRHALITWRVGPSRTSTYFCSRQWLRHSWPHWLITVSTRIIEFIHSVLKNLLFRVHSLLKLACPICLSTSLSNHTVSLTNDNIPHVYSCELPLALHCPHWFNNIFLYNTQFTPDNMMHHVGTKLPASVSSEHSHWIVISLLVYYWIPVIEKEPQIFIHHQSVSQDNCPR